MATRTAGETDEGAAALTALEAHVLAQVALHQPVTTYEVMRTLAASPAASLSGSTGTVYPIVRRLKQRGLVEASEVADDPRRAEHLRATDAGLAAARRWVGGVGEDDLLPPDPLRSKVLFLGLLSKRDRIRLLLDARRALDAKLEGVDAYAAAHPGPYAELAYAGARGVLIARRRWLEDVLIEVSEDD